VVNLQKIAALQGKQESSKSKVYALLILLANPLQARDSSLLRSSLGLLWKLGNGLAGHFPASTANPLRSAAGASQSGKRVRQQYLSWSRDYRRNEAYTRPDYQIIRWLSEHYRWADYMEEEERKTRACN